MLSMKEVGELLIEWATAEVNSEENLLTFGTRLFSGTALNIFDLFKLKQRIQAYLDDPKDDWRLKDIKNFKAILEYVNAEIVSHFGNKYTLIPDPFNCYAGHNVALCHSVIWSVGKTPYDAIVALAAVRWNDDLKGVELKPMTKNELTDGFDWGYRFTSNGTSMKAAGINVPGGAIVTWWK